MRVGMLAMVLTIWAAGTLVAQAGPGDPKHTHGIWLEEKQFSQAEVTIAVGDTVVFLNDDKVMHNVFSSSEGLRFNLLRQQPGSRKATVFATPGSALIRCAFHSSMRLAVVVR